MIDRLIRAHQIHSMTGQSYRAVGLRGMEIVAVSTESSGLDDLVTARTHILWTRVS
jgi:hypothetical protein